VAAVLGGMLVSLAAAQGTSAAQDTPRMQASSPQGPISIAVLGDSDSHSYQDRLAFPLGGSARGGPFRETTLQWLEVLARLRPRELDPGPWQVFGDKRSWMADFWSRLGRPSRFPQKLDYVHNMALSGAVCADLHQGPQRQAARLLDRMNAEPTRWRDGVVVVRIGTNDVGDAESLEAMSRDPQGSPPMQRVRACTDAIAQAVSLIRGRHPHTRFVLVGLFNNAHWARNHGRWHDRAALENIERAHARYDDALRALAAADPRIAFFDDRLWFSRLWGDRAPDGSPAYRTVRLGSFDVRNADGDHPSHATLADGHAGAVWNGLWAQALVALLNERFAAGIPPITPQELARLLDPRGAFGM